MSDKTTSKRTLDAAALRAYRADWEAVAEIEREEQRRATVEQQWQQLNSLLGLAMALGIFEDMQKNNERDAHAVRARWNQLRAKLT
jgi:hypothetical protein